MATTEPMRVTTKDGIAAVIRCALTQDAANLLECALENLREGTGAVTQPDEMALTIEQERDWIQGYIDKPNALLLVAEVQGVIVGSINYRPHERRRMAHSGEFGMTLLPAWRSRGLGEALLRALLEWARGNVLVEKVGLRVLANNPRAIALYQKLGFIEAGRRPREIKYSDGTYVDDILMYLFV